VREERTSLDGPKNLSFATGSILPLPTSPIRKEKEKEKEKEVILKP
jgi:hypothetical protein